LEYEEQLYDLEHDPRETKNLLGQYPEVAERLARLLKRYRDQGFSRPVSPRKTEVSSS
jgi:hypothetical protein